MFSIYDPWAPLTDVMVGSCGLLNLPAIPDNRTQDSINAIVDQTQEDLDHLAAWLIKRGITVHRPSSATNHHQRPMVSPRDHILVVKDQMFVDQADFPEFSNTKSVPTVNGSSVHYLGDRVFLSQDVDSAAITWLGENTIRFYQPGHIDGWFAVPTPGLIVSGRDHRRPQLLNMFYRRYFPDHEVVYVNETLVGADWNVYRNHVDWAFVEQYLSTWIGSPEETIFEINMLILDSKNVVVNCIDDQVANALHRHGVTAHVIPFRHAAFWDCGLHCATADLSRKRPES